MEGSRRIATLTADGDDGWEVFHRARALVAAGVAITELTIGEHDIRTDSSILAAMDSSARGGHTGYAAIPGTPSFRAAIAERVTKRTGVPTGPENVLVTPGGQAALFAAHMGAVDHGEAALHCDPYYATYPGTIRAVGAVPGIVHCHAEDRFLPTWDALEAALASAPCRVRSLLINTPNNPTGVIYPPETLDIIARFCRKHDLWLISDEVYDTQIWEGAHLSPRALPGMVERTLVIGSMSKSHAMTGARCGWVVGPERMIGDLTTLATHTNYGVPGFIQDASVFALQQGEGLEHEVFAPFKRRREKALARLSQQQCVGVIHPEGAMYVMLDVRGTGMSGEAFANLALDTHRIAVMPGESFGHAAAGHIRVAFTVEDEALICALDTLLALAAAQRV
ncbi:MAG: pyridoxal phosphate-dependent aminotransferase [Pseudomonadota bacterium]